MNWFSGILVFIIIWWVVIFAVLPWGVRPQETLEPGHAAGAPQRPMLWRKVIATTVITCILWAGAYWLIESDYLSLRPPVN